MAVVSFGEADGVRREVRVTVEWSERRRLARADVRSYLVFDMGEEGTWEVDSLSRYEVAHDLEPMKSPLPRRMAELQASVDWSVAHRVGKIWTLVEYVARTEKWELTGATVQV